MSTNINYTYNKIHDFSSSGGTLPFDGLFFGNDGFLYGTTSSGGTYNYGTIFKIDPTTYNHTVLHHFSGGTQGYYPYGGLIQGNDGVLYGTTWDGSNLPNRGVIFSCSTSGNYGVLYNLGTNNNVAGALLEVSNGVLYGTSYVGGIYGVSQTHGSIFSCNTLGTNLTMLYSFSGSVNNQFPSALPKDGRQPNGNLIKATNGVLYGTTVFDGLDLPNNGGGIIFSYTTSGVYQVLKRFSGGTTDGRYPVGGLIQASNGNLYGTTSEGGILNYGTIFSYDLLGNYQLLYNFSGTTDGQNPFGSLVQGDDGLLYGMTVFGGSYSAGTIFSFNISTNTLTLIHDFEGAISNDGNPTNYFYNNISVQNRIIQAPNGKLYGLTYGGGQYSAGTIYEFYPFDCIITGVTVTGCTNLGFVSGDTTDPTCTNNGEITITISGGNPDYVYSLNGGTYTFTGSSTTHTFTGLSQGTYVGSVSDSIGNNTIILNPFVLTNSFYVDFYTASTSTTGSTYCYIVTGLTESYVNVSIDGGTIFTASTNTTNCFNIPISSTITNHSILISQPISGSPCTYNTNFQSQNPYTIDIDVTITGGCGYSTATVNLTGGSPTYTYYAQNGNDIRTNISSLSSITFNNLTSGNWSFWTIDSNGISSQTQNTVSILNPFNANVTRINDLNICFEITGGTAPYDIYIDGLLRASGATGTTHCFTADCATNHTYSIVDHTPDCLVNNLGTTVPIFSNPTFTGTGTNNWVNIPSSLPSDATGTTVTFSGGSFLFQTSITGSTPTTGIVGQGYINNGFTWPFPQTPTSVRYRFEYSAGTVVPDTTPGGTYAYLYAVTPFTNYPILIVPGFPGVTPNQSYSGFVPTSATPPFNVTTSTLPYSGYGFSFVNSFYRPLNLTFQLNEYQLFVDSYTYDCRCTISGTTNSGCTPPVLVLDDSGGGSCDAGYAYVSITGGRPSYTYTASGDTVIVNSTGIFTNLTSGVWTIQAEDALNQFTNTVTFTITNQFYTNMTTIGNDILCVTVTGGTPPYNISIDGIFKLSATTEGTYCFSGYSATCDTLHTYSVTDSTPPCTVLTNVQMINDTSFLIPTNWTTGITTSCTISGITAQTLIQGGSLTYTSTTAVCGGGGCYQTVTFLENVTNTNPFTLGKPISATYQYVIDFGLTYGQVYSVPYLLTPLGNYGIDFRYPNTPNYSISAAVPVPFPYSNNTVYSGTVSANTTNSLSYPPTAFSGYGIGDVFSGSYCNGVGQFQLNGLSLTLISYVVDCTCTSSGTTYLPCLTPPVLYVDFYTATCQNNSGYVELHGEYGTEPYQFSAICSGVTYEVNSTGIFTGLTFCNWEFVVSDASGFTSQSEFVNIEQSNFSIDVTSPNGETICVTITGGTAPYTIYLDGIIQLDQVTGTSYCFSATCGDHTIDVVDSSGISITNCSDGMDVVFLIDYTASMGTPIDAIKSGITSIVNTIVSNSSVNGYSLGLVTFDENFYQGATFGTQIGIYSYPYYTSLPLNQRYQNIKLIDLPTWPPVNIPPPQGSATPPYTPYFMYSLVTGNTIPLSGIVQYITAWEVMSLNNQSTFISRLNNLNNPASNPNTGLDRVGSGLNGPEPSDMGIDRIVNYDLAGSFRNNVKKIIILITDTVASGDDDLYTTGLTSDESFITGYLTNSCNAKNINVLLMRPNYFSWYIGDALQQLSVNTGGNIYTSFSPTEIQNALEELCSGATIVYETEPCSATTTINLSCTPIIDYSAYTASTCFDDGVIEIGVNGGIPNYVYYAVNLISGVSITSTPTSANTYTFTGLGQGTWNLNVTDSLGNISSTISITFTNSVGFNFYTANTTTTGTTFCYSITGSNLTLVEGYYFADYSASTTNDPSYFTAYTNTINCFDVPVSGCGTHIFTLQEYNIDVNTYVVPPPYDCTNGMDVVFLVDYTSSMGGIINGVKSGITQIVNTISNVSNNNYRIGLVVYDENCNRPNSSLTPYNTPYYTALPVLQKHRYNNLNVYKNPPCGSITGISQFITAIQPFTTNSVTFTNSLNNLNTPTFPIGTGLGLPDPGDIGLRDILFPQLYGTSGTNNTFVGNFRNNVAKIVIFITDTLISGDDDTYNDTITTLENECIAQGIRVILMRNCPSCTGDVLESLATNTSGFTVTNYSPSAIQSAIETFCTGVTVTEIVQLPGCSFTTPYYVPCGNLFIEVTDYNNPYCADYCFGDITLHATGGTLPYTYELTDINGNILFNGLNLPLSAISPNDTYMFEDICASGNSSITLFPRVIDSLGLVATASSVTITYTFNFTVTVSNVINAGLTGTICLDISGDAPNGYPIEIYSGTNILVSATTGNLGQNCFVLPAGQCYNFIVQDAIGIQCSDQLSACIPLNPFGCDEHSSYTNPTCDQNAFGTITLSVSGGVSPYDYYLYYNGGVTPQYSEINSPLSLFTFINLSAGTYTAVIVDSNGISANCYTNIVLVNDFYVDVVQTTSCLNYNIYCVTASGGTEPYYVDIGDGFIQMSAGTSCFYIPCGISTIYVYDSADNPCTYSESFTASCPVNLSVSTTNGSCNGSQFGSITISNIGGLAPFQYSINGITFTTNNYFTGLTVGSYTAYIQDANGCSATLPVSITSTNPILINVITTGENCDYNNIGTITINASGGTPPYQYSIDGGTTVFLTNYFTGLTAGSYDIYVRDTQGCITEETVIVDGALSITSTTTDVSCNFGSGGTITVTVGSGNPPYQYSIDGGSFGNNNYFTGITAGAHYVTVIDVSGCSATTITQVNGAFTITPAIQYPDCNSGATGVINTFVTGGLPPYQYSIDGITYSSSGYFSGLTSDTYTIYVQDSLNCSGSTVVDLTIDELIIAVAGTVVNDCIKKGEGGGGPNGRITITIIYPGGGSGPYTYSINGGLTFSSNNVFTGLTSGTYNIVACDTILSCCTTDQIILPAVPHVTISATATPVNCSFSGSGSIDVTINGGTPTYFYSIYKKLGVNLYTLIANGSTSNTNLNINGLTYGEYLVNVYDFNGCLGSQTVIVNQPITVSGTSTSETCSYSSGGTITINASSGTPPYQYALSGQSFSTNNYFTGLTVGDYTFIIIDASGCTATTNTTIYGPISLSAETTDVTCLSSTAGTISVSVITGGTAPYTYSFNGGSFNSTTYFSGLTSGDYTISVLDASGCSATTIVTINPPYTISIDAFSTPETCGSGGTITALGVFGTEPYTYSINGGTYSIINYFTDLTTGTYDISVIDASGCSTTTSVDVGYLQPFSLTAITTPENCLYNSGGTINININGGVPNFEYFVYSVDNSIYTLIQNGSFNSNTITLLGFTVGSYVLNVYDSNQCLGNVPINIDPPILLSGTSTSETCSYSSGGTITLNGTSGVPPYQYALSGGSFSSNNYFTGLTVGDYTFIIMDGSGCTATTTITVFGPISLSAETTDVTCLNSSAGTINISVLNGGIAPYTFSFEGGLFSNISYYTGLTSGDYTISVLDSSGCSATTIVTINPPPTIGLDGLSTPETCYSAGTITALGVFGIGPYDYSFDGGTYSSNNYFTGLTAGTYSITAIDSLGCSASTNVIVDYGQPFELSATTTASACVGGVGGTITIYDLGGTPPYEYSLDGITWYFFPYFGNITIGLDILGILIGNYTLYVRDATGCIATTDVSVSAQSYITVSAVTTPENCQYSSGATATVYGSGGTEPYTYSIDGTTFVSNNYFTGLTVGTYTITVQDADGCEGTLDITIDPPIVISGSSTPETCLYNSGGTITVTGTTGNPPYQYSVDGGAFTNNNYFTGLTVGDHNIIVQDASGCSATTVVTIDPPIIVSATTTPEDCLLSSAATTTLFVTMGVSPYQYALSGQSFSSNNYFTGLTVGTYTFIAQDASGCSATTVVTIDPPIPVTVSATSTDESCYLNSGGTITITANGGNPPYQYSIDSGTTFSSSGYFNGKPTGTYGIVVLDTYGCSATTSVSIGSPIPMSATSTVITATSCYNNSIVEVTLNPSGGTSPYTFYWPDLSANTQTVTINDYLDIPGYYSILGYVFDRFGCSAYTIADFTIEEPLDVSLILYSSGTLTCDGSDYVTLSAVTTPQYNSINWSNGDSGVSFITANTPGSYYYYVEISGCTYTSDTIDLDYVIIPPTIGDNVEICVCNSTELIFIDNGYEYTDLVWSNGDSGTTATTVSSCTLGTYTYYLTAIDDKGCSVTSNTVTVTYVQLDANLFTTNPTCDGCTDGYAEIQIVSGGQAPFNFYWTGITNNLSYATGLTNGVVYTVEVVDATGCYAIFTFELNVDPCVTRTGDPDPLCDCTYIPYTNLGDLILNTDGTISFFNPNLPSGNIVDSVTEICCINYSTEELPLYYCEGSCYWTLSGCSTDSEVTDKIILGINGSQGVQLINPDTDNCNYQVSFDYLFNFDCETLFHCIDEESIYSGNVLSFLSGLSAYATVEVLLSGNTYLTKQIVPIWRFNFYNQPTGVYFGGDNIYCDIINQFIYNELGLNCSALTENTFAAIWQHASFKIFDSLNGEVIKIGLILEGFNCKYNILLDNLKIEQVCVIKSEEILSDNDCPGFDLVKVIDNKKSWVYNESLNNRDWYHLKYRDTSYDDYHERLDINTKEVDLEIDVASAIEYDAYCYALSEPCYFSNDCNNPELYINQGRFINNNFIRPGGLKKSLKTSGLTIGEQYIINFGIQKNSVSNLTVNMAIGFETPGVTSEQLYLEGINLTAGGFNNVAQYFSYTATVPTYTGVLVSGVTAITEYTNFYIKISPWLGSATTFSIINSNFSSVSIIRVCDQAILNPSEFVTITPELTFSEFKELLQTQMIDVKDRQSISDYPLLRFMFDRYLGLCNLNDCNTQSNQYNYSTLNSFVGLLGDYWMDIMEQFVPATTIWKAGTRTYRNTIFDQPKFEYRNFSLGYCSDLCTIIPTSPNVNTICYIESSQIKGGSILLTPVNFLQWVDGNIFLSGLNLSPQILTSLRRCALQNSSYSGLCDCVNLPLPCFISANVNLSLTESQNTVTNSISVTDITNSPNDTDILNLLYLGLTQLGYSTNINPSYNGLEWSKNNPSGCTEPIQPNITFDITYSCITGTTITPGTGFTLVYEVLKNDFNIEYNTGQLAISGDTIYGVMRGNQTTLGTQGGNLYSFNKSTNTYTPLIIFGTVTNPIKYPSGGLILGNDGWIYGTTLYNSDPIYFNWGALFRYNPFTLQYQILISFNPTVCNFRVYKTSRILYHSNGKIYIPLLNFTNLESCIYELDITQPTPVGRVIKYLYYPTDEIFLSEDIANVSTTNDIMVTTKMGGTNNKGTIVSFEPILNSQTNVRFDFGTSTTINCKNPNGPILQSNISGSYNLFYGLTNGSTPNEQTLYVFDITQSNTSTAVSILHRFNGITPPEGRNPEGNLIMINNKLYGHSTAASNALSCGNIFEYDLINSQYSIIHQYDTVSNGCNLTGAFNYLYYNSIDNSIYGITPVGGLVNPSTKFPGTLFKFEFSGTAPTYTYNTGQITCNNLSLFTLPILNKIGVTYSADPSATTATTISGISNCGVGITTNCPAYVNNPNVEVIVEDLTNINSSPCIEPPIIDKCNIIFATHIDNDIYFEGNISITGNTFSNDDSVLTNDQQQA